MPELEVWTPPLRREGYPAAIRPAFAPLSVPPFGRLLASYVINRLGDFVGLVALSVLVYDRTHDAMATAGLFIAAEFAPALLAPLLTARIDRHPPRGVLVATYAVEAVLFAVLAVLAGAFSLPAVYALVLVDGVLVLSARGISRSAVSRVLDSGELLREGNALLNLGFALAAAVGAALGGILVGAFGAGPALIIDAVTFALVAVLLATGPAIPGAPAGAVGDAGDGTIERMRAGLRYARRNPTLRLILVAEPIAICVFTLILPVEVIYAKVTLGTGDTGYGVLLAIWSVGTVAGSLLYVAARRRSPLLMIAASTAAIGVAYLGMGASRTIVFACAFALLGGTGNGIQWVSVMTVVQQRTPQDLQARVAGLLESLGSAANGLGFLAGGLAGSLFAPSTAFYIAGAGSLALMLLTAPFTDALRASSRSSLEQRSAKSGSTA